MTLALFLAPCAYYPLESLLFACSFGPSLILVVLLPYATHFRVMFRDLSRHCACTLIDVTVNHLPRFGTFPFIQFGILPVFESPIVARAGLLAFLLGPAFAPILPDTPEVILQFGVEVTIIV